MGSAPVVGSRKTFAPDWALMINGTAAHALDFDDLHPDLIGHPSACLFPVLLQGAAQGHGTGEELLVAYIAGVETQLRLAQLLGAGYYQRGWHATSVLGTLGGAASVAVLEKLGVEQTAMALGISASMAAGVRDNFGSMTKALHVGQAARNGWLAAILAKKGYTSSITALSGTHGLISLLGEETNGTTNDWQDAPLFGQRPLEIKFYPCCGAIQTAVELALNFRRQGLAYEAVEAVVLEHNETAGAILGTEPYPRSPAQAKFHMEYCVAVALQRGNLDLSDFSAQALARPGLDRLAARIERRSVTGLQPAHGFPARMQIRMTDGSTWADELAEAPQARTMVERWSRWQMKAKTCLQGWPLAENWFAYWPQIQNLDDAATLVGILQSQIDD